MKKVRPTPRTFFKRFFQQETYHWIICPSFSFQESQKEAEHNEEKPRRKLPDPEKFARKNSMPESQVTVSVPHTNASVYTNAGKGTTSVATPRGTDRIGDNSSKGHSRDAEASQSLSKLDGNQTPASMPPIQSANQPGSTVVTRWVPQWKCGSLKTGKLMCLLSNMFEVLFCCCPNNHKQGIQCQ